MRPPILLLENAPIHPQAGELFPSYSRGCWEASPLRQMNWLWQMWELWAKLWQSWGWFPACSRPEQYSGRRLAAAPCGTACPIWMSRLLWQNFDSLWRSLLSSLHVSVSAPLTTLLNDLGAKDIEIDRPDSLDASINCCSSRPSPDFSPRFALAGATAHWADPAPQ
jgi:protein phosphatase